MSDRVEIRRARCGGLMISTYDDEQPLARSGEDAPVHTIYLAGRERAEQFIALLQAALSDDMEDLEGVPLDWPRGQG